MVADKDTKPRNLFNKNFILLWQGQQVSRFGSSISSIAMTIWIVTQTNSAWFMSIAMTAAILPEIILGPIAGAFCDRISKKSIIVMSDAAQGFIYLILAIVFYFYHNNTTVIMAAILLHHIFISTAKAFFCPAIIAILPDLVPKQKVSAALSLERTSSEAAAMLGKYIGGLLYRIAGAPLLLFIDAITFILSAVSELFIQEHKKDLQKHRVQKISFGLLKRDTAAGFSYVWQYSSIRTLFLYSTLSSFFIHPIFVALPFFLKQPDYLASANEWVGIVLAAVGLGSFAGNWGTTLLKDRVHCFGVLIMGCMVGLGICYSCMALINNAFQAAILMFTGGFFCGLINNHSTSTLQVLVPQEKRAITFAIMNTISSIAAPAALLLSGMVVEVITDLRQLFLGCGFFTICVALMAISIHDYRVFLNSGTIESNNCAATQLECETIH